MKVTNSDATWEAVQSVPEEPEVIIDDENFSNPVVSEWIRRANTSPTLKASFFSAKVEPYEKTVRDALVVKMDDGTYGGSSGSPFNISY